MCHDGGFFVWNFDKNTESIELGRPRNPNNVYANCFCGESKINHLSIWTKNFDILILNYYELTWCFLLFAFPYMNRENMLNSPK